VFECLKCLRMCFRVFWEMQCAASLMLFFSFFRLGKWGVLFIEERNESLRSYAGNLRSYAQNLRSYASRCCVATQRCCVNTQVYLRCYAQGLRSYAALAVFRIKRDKFWSPSVQDRRGFVCLTAWTKYSYPKISLYPFLIF
jgi:hypothetical protein